MLLTQHVTIWFPRQHPSKRAMQKFGLMLRPSANLKSVGLIYRWCRFMVFLPRIPSRQANSQKPAVFYPLSQSVANPIGKNIGPHGYSHTYFALVDDKGFIGSKMLMRKMPKMSTKVKTVVRKDTEHRKQYTKSRPALGHELGPNGTR